MRISNLSSEVTGEDDELIFTKWEVEESEELVGFRIKFVRHFIYGSRDADDPVVVAIDDPRVRGKMTKLPPFKKTGTANFITAQVAAVFKNGRALFVNWSPRVIAYYA